MKRLRTAGLVLAAGCALLSALACESAPPVGLPAATDLERRGDAALNEGRADVARALFAEAQRGRERPFLAWIGVARASIALDDLASAEIACRQAMSCDYGSAASAELLGRTLLMLAQARGPEGRSQAIVAATMFDAAARLDPSFPGLHYHRGLAQLFANEPRSAVPYLELAYRLEGGSERATRALVLVYRRLGAREATRSLLRARLETATLPPGFEGDLEWAESDAASRPASGPAITR